MKSLHSEKNEFKHIQALKDMLGLSMYVELGMQITFIKNH